MIELSKGKGVVEYPLAFNGKKGRGEQFLQAFPSITKGLISCMLNTVQGLTNDEYISTGVVGGIRSFDPRYTTGRDNRVRYGSAPLGTDTVVHRIASVSPAIKAVDGAYHVQYKGNSDLASFSIPAEDASKTPDILRSPLYFKGLKKEGDSNSYELELSTRGLLGNPYPVQLDNSRGNSVESLKDVFESASLPWLEELDVKLVVDIRVVGESPAIDYFEQDSEKAAYTLLTLGINVAIQLTIPEDIGAWLVGNPVTGDSETSYLAPLYSWASKVHGAGLKARGKPRVERNITLDRFEESLEPRLQGHAKPRYSKDRLLVLRTGRVVYIPPIKKGAVNLYNKAMLSLYDEKTGTFHISSTPADHPNKEALDKIRSGLQGMGLLEDWVTETYFYALSGSLGVGSINLTSSKGTTTMMLINLLSVDTITNYISNISANLEGADADFAKHFKESREFLDSEYPNVGVTNVLETLLGVWNAARMYASTSGSITAKNLFIDSFENYSDTAQPRNSIIAAKLLKPLAEYLIEVGRKEKPASVYKSFNDIIHKGPVMVAIGLYGSEMKERYKYASETLLANKAPITTDDINNADLAIPGVMDGMKAFPHQSKALLELKKEGASDAVLMAVQPGGGKTIISILDMLKLLGSGEVKRPLLLAPTNLLGQWSDAISKFADGNLNYYAFTTSGFGIHGNALFDRAKKAPRNTVFMSSYSFISQANRTTAAAGGEDIPIYRNAVELEAFNFDYIVMDESHYLKNAESGRLNATSRLILQAKYVRFASGTLINDNPSDLVGVGTLIDPSLFGKKSDFLERYAGKSGTWSDGAATKVNDLLRTSSTEIRAKQSDWAFMLPKLVEHFHHAELTENQRDIYARILKDEIDELMNRPAFAKKFKALRASDPESADRMLEGAMRQFLTKAEMFLVNPKSTGVELADDLEEADLISPKVMMADKIIDEHLASKDTGKIIVFYSNVTGTDHFMEYTKHKDISIQYHGKKKTDLSKFYYDDSTRVLVATEATLNTGFNFQFATRMIRIQTLWSPGDQAQALARIFRPDVDDSSRGKVIHFDWLIINNTMDVTKVGKLIGKTVSNTKFEEVNNPYFNASRFPELDKIKMSPEVIEEYSTFNDITQYIDAYSALKAFRDSEFDRNSALFPEMIPIKSLPVPKDFKKIGFTPYVPNMSPDNVPNKKDLGLVRYLEHTAKLDVANRLLPDPLPPFNPKGSYVQTELGIGLVMSSSSEKMQVKLAGGRRVSFGKDVVFLIVAPTENGKQLIEEGLSTGAPAFTQPPTPPIEDEEPTDGGQGHGTLEDDFDTNENSMIEMFAGSFNNHLFLSAYQDDPDSEQLLDHGFRSVMPYWVAEIKTANQLDAVIDTLDAKFEVRGDMLDDLESFRSRLHKKSLASIDVGNWRDIKNFWLLQHQAVKGNVIRPYAIVQNGKLYIAVSSKAPAAHRLGSVNVKGVHFTEEPAQLYKFFRNIAAAKAQLADLADDGLVEYKERTIKRLQSIPRGRALPSSAPKGKEPKGKEPKGKEPRPRR